jgi:hypothetical protein
MVSTRPCSPGDIATVAPSPDIVRSSTGALSHTLVAGAACDSSMLSRSAISVSYHMLLGIVRRARERETRCTHLGKVWWRLICDRGNNAQGRNPS